MEKDTLYFALKDSLEENVCPICSIIKARTTRAMESLLYESAIDPKLRERWGKDRGLCNSHAKMLCDLGDPLAHAILYRDLIGHLQKDLKRDSFDKYTKIKPCRYCEFATETEANMVFAFLEDYPFPDFSDAYRENGLLCAKHMELLFFEAKKQKAQKVYEEIKSVTLEKLAHLEFSLSEIIRKSDYRFNNEAWTEEETEAWKKAVGIINEDTRIRRLPDKKRN